MRAGSAMLGYMEIREAKPGDWPHIWLILDEVGSAGETLTWDATRTEARARAGWMRDLPGRTIVAVDDDGTVLGSANTQPIHAGPGAHVANAGFVVDPARQGEVLGVNQSAAALARILGPMTAVTLFFMTPTHEMPYILGSALLVVLLLFSFRLRQEG